MYMASCAARAFTSNSNSLNNFATRQPQQSGLIGKTTAFIYDTTMCYSQNRLVYDSQRLEKSRDDLGEII